MNHLHKLSAIVVAVLASTGGAIAFISLWPFFDIVGKLLVGLLAVAVGCGAFLLCYRVYYAVGIWNANLHERRINSRLLRAEPGHLAALPMPDGTVLHLSAEHMAASVVPHVSISEVKNDDGPSKSSEDVVKELHSKGLALRTIAQATGHTYYSVRKIVGDDK